MTPHINPLGYRMMQEGPFLLLGVRVGDGVHMFTSPVFV